jgi:hypothetical protein
MNKMKCNPWTIALLGAGIVSLPSIGKAEEKVTPLQTALATTTLSGYVDTSAQWNIGTGNASLPPYAFGGAGKADGFNLNVVELRLDRPIDTGEQWSAGYRVDLLAGPDANAFNTHSTGFNTGSDFGIKQAYVALHTPVGNGLDFKMGVWDTIIGYEVFESGNNPNVTRSYGYTMEPTTHTGLLATYLFSECLSFNAGIANTFGPTINGRSSDFVNGDNSTKGAESFKTYMASFTYTVPTNCGVLAGSTLTGCIINGFNSATLNALGQKEAETSYYLGATVNTPIKNLKAGAAFDYMDVHNTSGETWVIGGYLAFQATEKLSLYGRGEYIRDRGDQKFFGPFMPDRAMELTGTVQYDLWKNVMTRLEARWDHSLSGTGTWGGDAFPDSQKNAVVLIAQAIYKF